jgi:hypothetical protein
MEIKILVWVIISYGLMNIMVFGEIFENVRHIIKKWSESDSITNIIGKFLNGILSCPLCFGTWSGFFLSITLYSPTKILFETPGSISWFFDGLLSSGAVWAINSFVEFFEESRIK